MKKVYTATFKAQVVLELLKETKTLNQLAAVWSGPDRATCMEADGAAEPG